MLVFEAKNKSEGVTDDGIVIFSIALQFEKLLEVTLLIVDGIYTSFNDVQPKKEPGPIDFIPSAITIVFTFCNLSLKA